MQDRKSIHPTHPRWSRIPPMFARHAALTLALGAGACFAPTREAAPCESDSNCNLHAGGQCLPSPLGVPQCAYPSEACPSGLAWGELSPSLDLACVSNDSPVDARIPTCAELGCSPLGTFCEPDGSCSCTPPGGAETACSDSRDAGVGIDAQVATDAGSDGRLPTCPELGCSPLSVFCQPDGSCVCTPPGGSETPCTR